MTRIRKLIAGSVLALALAIGAGYAASASNAASKTCDCNSCCCKGTQCNCPPGSCQR